MDRYLFGSKGLFITQGRILNPFINHPLFHAHLLAAQVFFSGSPPYEGGAFLRAGRARPASHPPHGWAVCPDVLASSISLLHIWIQILDPKATNSMFTVLRLSPSPGLPVRLRQMGPGICLLNNSWKSPEHQN